MIGQAPRPGSEVVLLREGHAYQARWIAPVPCQLLGSAPSVSSLLSAMLQQLGSQFGRSQAWSTVRADVRPLPGWNPPPGHSGVADASANPLATCTVYTEATWAAPDTAVDPTLARLPGVGLVPLVDIWDAQTRELLYDRVAIVQPATPAPGTAPAPPVRPTPPATTAPAAPLSPKPSARGSGALVIGGLVIAALGIAAIAVSRS
jgi:hypothetical protein